MTNQNILFEMGMQQQLQTYPPSGSTNSPRVSGSVLSSPNILASTMNSDAIALANLYKKLKEDGELTRKEIAALDGVDQVLDNASIKINPQTGNAKITQNDGKEFEIKFR